MGRVRRPPTDHGGAPGPSVLDTRYGYRDVMEGLRAGRVRVTTGTFSTASTSR
ncbi:hypothetical protein [Streptomyces atratus]|uniref:hypothetical protein n=1 Tax=Streptomyces atratus TaxID=1893 RepID=UPI0033FF3357